MMQALRNNTKIIIIVIVVAFVGLMVFSWGMDISGRRGGTAGRPKDVVGRVNDRDISLQNFTYASDQYIENERKKTPDKDFTDEDYRKARRDTWNDFINGILQSDEIEKRKIRLTDPELVDFIKRYPPEQVREMKEFQKDGRFDYQKYMGAMSDPNYAQFWAQVEQIMRSQLINFKLQEYIAAMVRMNDLDVQDQYLRDNEKIKVAYALVPLNAPDFGPITIDTSQVTAYYNSHQDEFKVPELAYYTIIKAPKSPSQADTAQALQKIKDIKKQLDNGGDFTTIANAETMDTFGKTNGGDLGWFGHGQMVTAFDSAVFAMKDSTISDPIKTQFGYHIIFKKGSRKENGKEEVSAAHILIKPQFSTETRDDLNQRMQQFHKEVNAGNYSTLLSQYKFTEEQKRKLVHKGSIPGIGQNDDIEKFLFTASPGSFSDILDKTDALYIVRADRVAPPGISPLSEVRSTIEGNLRQVEQRSMAVGRAQRIYDAILSGKSFDDAAKTVGATVTESDFFARTGRLPSIGPDPAFIGAAFTLSDANRYSKPVLTQGGAAVIEFKERLAANLDGFAAQKDSLRSQTLLALQNNYWNHWFDTISKKAKIEDFRKDVFGDQY